MEQFKLVNNVIIRLPHNNGYLYQMDKDKISVQIFTEKNISMDEVKELLTEKYDKKKAMNEQFLKIWNELV